jgi:hypothetical protein
MGLCRSLYQSLVGLQLVRQFLRVCRIYIYIVKQGGSAKSFCKKFVFGFVLDEDSDLRCMPKNMGIVWQVTESWPTPLCTARVSDKTSRRLS